MVASSFSTGRHRSSGSNRASSSSSNSRRRSINFPGSGAVVDPTAIFREITQVITD